MNSEELQKIKEAFKNLLKERDIIDILIFGSFIKGKQRPGDIDIAIITSKHIDTLPEGFHISVIKPEEIIQNSPSIVSTLLRESYSLKHNRSWSENFRLKNRVLFTYSLKTLAPSSKVCIVNILHGKNNARGMVEEKGGEWLANQVFIMPIGNSHIIEKFFINKKIQFKKKSILID